MTKYRRRGIVTATQFFPDKKPWPLGVEEESCYCMELAQDGRHCPNHNGHQNYRLRVGFGTLLEIKPGDWVVVEYKKSRCYNTREFKELFEKARESA